MFEITQLIMLFVAGAFCAILGVLFGAWLSYKCHRAAPGERFLGGPPKGDVFSIPDLGDDEPEEMTKDIVKERLDKFMAQFNGGGK